MQKIKIEDTFSEGGIRMFAHLANLFFEQCEIITEDEEDAMKVDFIIDRNSEGITFWKSNFIK